VGGARPERKVKGRLPDSRRDTGATMKFIEHFRGLTPVQRNTFVACFLGWSLDAFDFFILIFCVNALAAHFHVKVSEIMEASFWTLAMRPVGAFLFGMMADRFGRRPTLMVDIILYSVFELSSAFAPSLKIFILSRALFGIAMGGEWGVGAALAFETLPAKGRGFFSGILQEGYIVGNLAASLVYGILFQFVGWRGMFVIGALPALLVIYIRTKVDESPAWVQGKSANRAKVRLGREIYASLGKFLFLVALMTAFNAYSHGAQDLYPTFLEKNLHFTPHVVGTIGTVISIGGLLGGICFGGWSERIGRRKAIVVASLISLLAIYPWVYATSAPVLAVGGFLMLFTLQGAWGVIPAHLNELSPPAVRGMFPGLSYQLGNLLASRLSVLQARAAEQHFSGRFSPVLAWTIAAVVVAIVALTSLGPEKRGIEMLDTASEIT
jgi:SHS family lactate transporter-like MFS transporter